MTTRIPSSCKRLREETFVGGPNKFPSEKEIKAAFAAGAKTIEVELPDGRKITIRKENGAAPKAERDGPEDIVRLLK